MLTQSGPTTIGPSWILLDSQSTISVFNNPSMLTNIRPSPHPLRALTNGAHQDSNMVGDFPNLGMVWFNPASIANILSLANVWKICRVTFDTSTETAFCVHRLDGTIMKFVEHPSGLFVFGSNPVSSALLTAYTLVNTVASQKKLFSARQIAAANAATTLSRKLGRPSDADFLSILSNNLIRNCPITPNDARRASLIYGRDVASLKGKMTCGQAAPRAPTFDNVPLPALIALHHRNVTTASTSSISRALVSSTPSPVALVSAPSTQSLTAPTRPFSATYPLSSIFTPPVVSPSVTSTPITSSNVFARNCDPSQ